MYTYTVLYYISIRIPRYSGCADPEASRWEEAVVLMQKALHQPINTETRVEGQPAGEEYMEIMIICARDGYVVGRDPY